MLECDLISKGGVASGVVYPRAIRRIAGEYRFRGVGGTSAGAIAAAAAAAAEYGRQNGTNATAFDQLEQLDEELARPGFIRSLFQPQVACAPLYWAVTSAARHAPLPSRAWRAVTGLARGYVSAARRGSFGLGLGHVNSPDSLFGMCTGMPTDPDASGEALTGWLHRWYQQLSGAEAPLTFADLERVAVRLRMVTTNVSREQPITLPFPFTPRADRDRTYLPSVSTPSMAFRRSEFERLFPGDVVDWLVRFSKALYDQKLPSHRLPEGFHWIPLGNDLPVLVAVRMSLSFPVLLSAIPLYTVPPRSYQRPRDSEIPEEELEINWFSDGGVTNNLPIQFFDTWVPTRPTFAINLTGRPRVGRTESPALADQVWRLRDGEHVPSPVREVRGVTQLLFGIASTAQSSRDELQMSVPGYRERVVHVYLSPDEGSLNLDMEPEVIRAMQEKGGLAGDRALEFGREQEEHRWKRLLSVLGHLDIQGWRLAVGLVELATGARPGPTGPEGTRPPASHADAEALRQTLRGIVAGGRDVPRPGDDAAVAKEREQVDLMLARLADFVAAIHGVRLAERIPRPPGVLRVVPEA